MGATGGLDHRMVVHRFGNNSLASEQQQHWQRDCGPRVTQIAGRSWRLRVVAVRRRYSSRNEHPRIRALFPHVHMQTQREGQICGVSPGVVACPIEWDTASTGSAHQHVRMRAMKRFAGRGSGGTGAGASLLIDESGRQRMARAVACPHINVSMLRTSREGTQQHREDGGAALELRRPWAGM
jgi:hypothetical protein